MNNKQGFRVLRTNGINVQMISQGASKVKISFNFIFTACFIIIKKCLIIIRLKDNKIRLLYGGEVHAHLSDVSLMYLFWWWNQVNISLIVNDDEAEHCVKALHSAFFETGTSKAVPQIGRLATTPLPCRENLLVQPDLRDLQVVWKRYENWY